MRDRSPTIKLVIAGLVGLVLLVPMVMVYGLISDRQSQARVAQDAITAGAGGPQVVSAPVLVVPYLSREETAVLVNGKTEVRSQQVRSEIVLEPLRHELTTALETQRKRKAIYETVVFQAEMEGSARFRLPEDLSSEGVTRDQLILSEAYVRFGVSDPRGLRGNAVASMGGESIELEPGAGTNARSGGFHGSFDWSDASAIDLDYNYDLRGSRELSLDPRGGDTRWKVISAWQHPGFSGRFLPESSEIGKAGFSASWSIGGLALGQSSGIPEVREREARMMVEAAESAFATIRLVEPADVYAQVDRSVKYGFLFIGFTFLTFLLFDVVGGARVAAAEYLLTGAGLVLFFVLLLAIAEMTTFPLAYVAASLAIIGLLTAYSAAVLGGWKRAGFIGGLLTALYAGLYVLLSLEEASLIVGATAMFFALAGVMYATRDLDWSQASVRKEDEAIAE